MSVWRILKEEVVAVPSSRNCTPARTLCWQNRKGRTLLLQEETTLLEEEERRTMTKRIFSPTSLTQHCRRTLTFHLAPIRAEETNDFLVLDTLSWNVSGAGKSRYSVPERASFCRLCELLRCWPETNSWTPSLTNLPAVCSIFLHPSHSTKHVRFFFSSQQAVIEAISISEAAAWWRKNTQTLQSSVWQ